MVSLGYQVPQVKTVCLDLKENQVGPDQQAPQGCPDKTVSATSINEANASPVIPLRIRKR